MTKHPKTRDERLYIDAKKKAKKQLKQGKLPNAREDNTDLEE